METYFDIRTNITRSIIYIGLFLSIAHGGLLACQPNGIPGDSLLGYAPSRFVLVVLSIAIAGVSLRLIQYPKIWQKLLTKTANHSGLTLALGGCLLLLSFVTLEILSWPATTLPDKALVLRENFSSSLVFFVALMFASVTILLVWVSRNREGLILYAGQIGLGFAYAHLRIHNALSFRYPITSGDAVDYIGFESISAMMDQNAIWQGTRPFVLPLIGTLLDQNAYIFAWLQTVISIMAWVFLAWVLSTKLRSLWLKVLGFAAVLVFSMGDRIISWDWSILSESLSFSGMAFLLAIWLLQVEEPSFGATLAAIALAFLWAFIRDLNAWLILIMALGILIASVLGKSGRSYTLAGVAYLLIFLLSSVTINTAEFPRWTIPYMHVLIYDVAPDKNAYDFFLENGLTTPPRVIGDRDPASIDFSGYTTSPEFSEFRTWLYSKGQITLAKYWLFSFPASAYRPLNPGDGFPLSAETRIGRTWDHDRLLPPVLEDLVNWEFRTLPSILLFSGLLCFGLYGLFIHGHRLLTVPLTGVLLAYPYAFLAWHGDAYSRTRHVLPADILLRTSLLIMAFLVVDILIHQRATGRNANAT